MKNEEIEQRLREAGYDKVSHEEMEGLHIVDAWLMDTQIELCWREDSMAIEIRFPLLKIEKTRHFTNTSMILLWLEDNKQIIESIVSNKVLEEL